MSPVAAANNVSVGNDATNKTPSEKRFLTDQCFPDNRLVHRSKRCGKRQPGAFYVHITHGYKISPAKPIPVCKG